MADTINPTPTPSIRRLDRQLRVDFATDVRVSGGGKRKREPTRSVYEEAAANMAKDTQKKKALKKQAGRAAKRIRRKQPRPSSTKKPTMQSEDQHQRMLLAAASLAQMSRTGKSAVVVHDAPVMASEKTAGFITKAHSDALLAAKDQAIRAADAALAAREELVRVQATLIAIMQRNAAAATLA